MNIKPKCRYCGTKVEHFGDICADCGGEPDGLLDLTRNDTLALQTRKDES